MAVNRNLKKLNQRSAPTALPKLAKEANKYHHKAIKHWFGLAENARKSGEAINQARYYGLWKRGTWKKWLEDNFDGSYETAKVYMRIAKKWNDPRLIEARKAGVTLDSINKILQVLSGKRNPDGSLNIKLTEAEFCSDMIRKMFGEKLKTELSKDDIIILTQECVFEYLWDKWYLTIRDIVCTALGYDPYEYEPKGSKFRDRWRQEEKMQRKVWRKLIKE